MTEQNTANSIEKKTFQLIRLEERIAPAHLPPVHVVELPEGAAENSQGIERAGEANHGRVFYARPGYYGC